MSYFDIADYENNLYAVNTGSKTYTKTFSQIRGGKIMQQYELYEIEIHAPKPQGSCVNADLTGMFEINGMKTDVRGFYKGNGIWSVRFCPNETGIYRYCIHGTDGAGEKIEKSGCVYCEPAMSGRHGIVHPQGTHFQYADGTWFYPFGTTVYALSHQEDALVEQTFETLQSAPFNKIRICVFPKHYDYNHNEPSCFAFVNTDEGWDTQKPDFVFWERLETHIRRLDRMGIQCDLILFHPYDCWGFSSLSREEALSYLDYAARRLSAFPNLWWSLANEYDMLDYKQEDWEVFAKFLHENDPYGHLLSNHEIVLPWDFSNPYTTHICHQTSLLNCVSSDIRKYQKPLMIDECCYEGNIPLGWGNISGFEMVNRFWIVCMQGGYCTHGETFYNAEEILWWSKGGRLTGESPARIGFLREIMECLPGPLTYNGQDMSEDGFQQMQESAREKENPNPFDKLLQKLTWKEAKVLLDAGKEYEGHYKEEAYMKYFARSCTYQGTLKLPKKGSYRVEIIDVWEMTRKTVLNQVSGETCIELPGKEGIAVLALRNS